MAIHYSGDISRKPGQIPHNPLRDLDAGTGEWTATTCNTCKVVGLHNLKLQRVEPGSETGTVTHMTSFQVGITFMEGGQPEWVTYRDLDSGAWQVAL